MDRIQRFLQNPLLPSQIVPLYLDCRLITNISCTVPYAPFPYQFKLGHQHSSQFLSKFTGEHCLENLGDIVDKTFR